MSRHHESIAKGALIGVGIIGAGVSLWMAFWMIVAAAVVVTLGLANLSALAEVQWPITAAFVLIGVGITFSALSRDKAGIRYTVGWAFVVAVTGVGTGILQLLLYPGGGAEVRARAIAAGAADTGGGGLAPINGDALSSFEAMAGVSNLILSVWGPWLFLLIGASVAIQGASVLIRAHKAGPSMGDQTL